MTNRGFRRFAAESDRLRTTIGRQVLPAASRSILQPGRSCGLRRPLLHPAPLPAMPPPSRRHLILTTSSIVVPPSSASLKVPCCTPSGVSIAAKNYNILARTCKLLFSIMEMRTANFSRHCKWSICACCYCCASPRAVVGKPIVKNVLAGFNACILAYGATSSGDLQAEEK